MPGRHLPRSPRSNRHLELFDQRALAFLITNTLIERRIHLQRRTFADLVRRRDSLCTWGTPPSRAIKQGERKAFRVIQVQTHRLAGGPGFGCGLAMCISHGHASSQGELEALLIRRGAERQTQLGYYLSEELVEQRATHQRDDLLVKHKTVSGHGSANLPAPGPGWVASMAFCISVD